MVIKRKKAALELSMGTIVILVLGISMLILGMVLVRNIMCGALGLTGDVNSKIQSELDRYFGTEGAEVACIGESGEPVKIIPDGNEKIIYCSIKAPDQAKYTISVNEATLDGKDVKSWLVQNKWSQNVAPGDSAPKKVVRVNVPENAPEKTLSIVIDIKRNEELILTRTLDFEITRVGFVKATMC